MQRDGLSRVEEKDTTLIKKGAVYHLVGRSRKPAAQAFMRWVYGEVLPSIRKTGEYVSKRRDRYRREGKQAAWVEVREEGIG